MVKSRKFRFKQSDIGKFAGHLAASDVVGKITKDCRVMGLTDGQFSLIDLIYSILQKTGRANICCTTWSAGVKDAHQIKWMLDTDLIDKFTLITDHSYKTRQHRYAVTLEDLFGLANIRTSEIHAKFTLIENAEWKICIRTSMNLNANRTCESFEIDEGDDVFDFYKKFVDTIEANMPEGFTSDNKTVQDALRTYFAKDEKQVKNWYDL